MPGASPPYPEEKGGNCLIGGTGNKTTSNTGGFGCPLPVQRRRNTFRHPGSWNAQDLKRNPAGEGLTYEDACLTTFDIPGDRGTTGEGRKG